MNIPGSLYGHVVITNTCRENRGALGAFDEAVRQLRERYLECFQSSEPTPDTEFHAILVVQSERHRNKSPHQIGD